MAACAPSCTRRAALSRRNPRRSLLSPCVGLRSSSGPPATIRTHVNLQCISSPPFRGWLPWRMAPTTPRWWRWKCGALRIGSTRCETEMMEQQVAEQLTSLSGQKGGDMKALLDKQQFGPWALVTGASSGIGVEFARQIAAAGINLVLVARREALLNEVGRDITRDFGVQFRALTMDLSEEGFILRLAEHTKDLDIGLVVSNSGTANPGEFLKLDRQLLEETLRLNTMSHLDIAHYFGRKLAARRRGGVILVGAMGAANGIPWIADD